MAFCPVQCCPGEVRTGRGRIVSRGGGIFSVAQDTVPRTTKGQDAIRLLLLFLRILNPHCCHAYITSQQFGVIVSVIAYSQHTRNVAITRQEL